MEPNESNPIGATDLLAIVSQELTMSLATIIEMASRITALAPAELPNRSVQAWAEEILRSAHAIEQLIRGIRGAWLQPGTVATVAAVRSGAHWHNLAELIDHAVDIFLPVAANASIALTSEIQGPILASYDSPRLFEALAHVIENAIEYTPAGGSIRIRASCDWNECVVSVADTGVGIPPPQLVTIFEPFQERSPGDRRSPATGLSTARWIVEAHRGRIWAESDVGVGSTFYFALPLA
jgi:signal transduction histidine kinase